MLETGTLSESDEVVLRATMSLDPDRRRVLAGSAGFVSLRPPIVGPAVAAASTALRGDVGLVWGLSTWLQATVRYSISHQYWSGTSSTVHVLLAGLTFHFSNADRLPPVPAPGQRVDGAIRCGSAPSRAGHEDRVRPSLHIAHVLSSLELGGQERVALTWPLARSEPGTA